MLPPWHGGYGLGLRVVHPLRLGAPTSTVISCILLLLSLDSFSYPFTPLLMRSRLAGDIRNYLNIHIVSNIAALLYSCR